MYKYKLPIRKSLLRVNESYAGMTIETKVETMMENKEPIKASTPLIFTERKEGVRPSTDIRTDRFEIAIDAMDYVQRSKMAERQARSLGEQAKEGMDRENISGAEPTQGTDSGTGQSK